MPGYALAALTMDRLGRKTIQCLGFAMMAITFLAAGLYSKYSRKWRCRFSSIYGLSFFFTEFGVKSTTFVYPSEKFSQFACEPQPTASLPPWVS